VAAGLSLFIRAEPEFTCPSEESSSWLFLIRNSVSSSRVGNTGDRLEEKAT
jgi:hypothetical protein